MRKQEFIENVHYYLEDGKLVMTEVYHAERGFCCGKQCRHCCFDPKYIKGNTNIKFTDDKTDLSEKNIL
jgi:hypothetical protein